MPDLPDPSAAPPFDALAILAVLAKHHVSFVVIGGWAAVAQGSPIPTRDVDVVPLNDRVNLTRVSTALTELDARIRTGGEPLAFAHDATSLAGATFWNLTTKHGDLDISFLPSGTQGYPDLRRDAIEVTLRGTPVLLASLADIVRSKEAAGRDKDRRALPILRELVAEQLRAKRQRD
jgi:hypothetical protein